MFTIPKFPTNGGPNSKPVKMNAGAVKMPAQSAAPSPKISKPKGCATCPGSGRK